MRFKTASRRRSSSSLVGSFFFGFAMTIQRSVLGPDHLQAIGRVAAQWAILELNLHLILWGLLDVPQRSGHAITAAVPSMNTKLHMLRSLAKESGRLSSTAKTNIETLLTSVSDLRTDRNNIVHATWSVSEKPGAFNRSKFTGWGEVKFHDQDLTAPEINQIADDIASLAGDLTDFARENGLNPPLS